ncbi:Eco57I restriction-modification methylase domain-containing protein [Microbacterium horticulturae]|uniref:site-specific DNA-methyltransferase (adenine-specific) n=1 Tax=Microbacterium horticulturae TaxID=3028316 RepID=A0ABY8C141_9MICO|nr:Eco57I restriction-modification methylase domain-containing protein [Microbacterium sp. KACC 23027]WEG08373.1 Eco57I restriction-modification methylase domain-containing protein [Microbacterium sp. KACC 23027]
MSVPVIDGKASFALRGHNPDVLTCIANLSNDEVFTPPELANQMLDTVADAWAEAHDGASIWSDPDVTFLDPFTKSGVFLREITRRLTEGLAEQIPDLWKRVDHILTKQVYGIGITRLTALLARRSVYCSKDATGEHSIATSFDRDWGNIWFERTEHTWAGDKCAYCGASKQAYDRAGDLETHAYAFIHTTDIKKRLAHMFGADVQFDVIIGNPPYQLGESGGEAVGSFAMPVYQKFVDVAKQLEPRFLEMVTPSRWFAGGRGLAEFRAEMLGDRRLKALVDYPDSRDVFAGVDIAGGVSYFLWDRAWDGACEVSTVIDGVAETPMSRYLDEYDLLVRSNRAVSILHKVLTVSAGAEFASLASVVAPIQPFSIRTNFRGAETSAEMVDPVKIYQNGGFGWIERTAIPRNVEWVDQWKVIVSGAVPAGGRPDARGQLYGLIGIRVLAPGTACTETYLVANRFSTEQDATRFANYIRTKFVRFLVSVRTNTHHLYSERFAFVPDLPMDRVWTDQELYEKYALSDIEVSYIESAMRASEPADA